MFKRSDELFDEREHIWITIDIKNLPSQIITDLASFITDPDVLDVLADSPNASTRLQVAKNVWTLGKTLKRLAKDPIDFIKEEVASHFNTFTETLVELSNDESERVRSAAVSNLHTPVDTLILKLFDPCRYVVIAAIQNPKTPKENVKMLIDSEDFLIAFEARKRLKKE